MSEDGHETGDPRVRRRWRGIATASIVAVGIAAASAAALGIDQPSLGADTSVVAACDSDGAHLSLDTATVDGTTDVFHVTGVVVSGLAATCMGQAGTVVVAQADGTPLATSTFTTPATGWTTDDNSQSASLDIPVPARLVQSVSVVISG